MANWTAYKAPPVLLDVTVTSVTAGSTVNVPVTGSTTTGGTAATTANSILTSVLAAGFVADALTVEITSPVQALGSYPDATVWLTNGSENLQMQQVYDGSAAGNMFPRWKLTRGQIGIVLGQSTRDLLRANARQVSNGGAPVKNLPTRITGIKVTNQLTVSVQSVAGWTTGALVPMRIVIRGDVLSQDDLLELSGYPYPGQIDLSAPPAARFMAQHALTGSIDTAFGSLPGGNHQGKVKVNRRISFAYNAVATSASNQFAFSQNNQVQGASPNVANTFNDLGFANKTNNNAFLLTEFGVNILAPGTSAYIAMLVDGAVVPQDTPQGTSISTGNNNLAYGQVNLNGQGSDANAYDAVPVASKVIGSFLAYKGTLVPAITATGTAIAPNKLSVALLGVQITQGS